MKAMHTMMLMALLSTPAFAASPIQNGAYKGAAQWKSSAAQSGTYNVTTTIADGTVTSSYAWDNGQTQTWTFSASPDANGVFEVVSGGQKVGEGYCFDVQCHYTAFNGNLEETLTFYGNALYKLGSKRVNGTTIIWQEQLSLTAR